MSKEKEPASMGNMRVEVQKRRGLNRINSAYAFGGHGGQPSRVANIHPIAQCDVE